MITIKKYFNSATNSYQPIEVTKQVSKDIPYQLSYRRWLRENGLSFNDSFHNDSLLRSCFDKLYLDLL